MSTATVSTALLTNGSSGNATTASSDSAAASDVIPKSVITICILVAGFLLGVVVAKLVNYCYNRADVPDNASDISEHTKGLLRIQLALLKFGKSGTGAGAADAGQDPEEAKRQQQATVLSMWKMKAMTKAAAQKAQEEQAIAADSVQVVNEAAGWNKKGKKGGAAAKSDAASAKPKTVARPKKLFPNSVAGVVLAASSLGATGTATTATVPAASSSGATAREKNARAATSSVNAKARAQSPGGKSSQDKAPGGGSDPSQSKV